MPLSESIHAPVGLVEALRELPYLGTLQCSTTRLVAGEWAELEICYTIGSSGIADGATFKVAFRFYSDWALFQTENPSSADFVSVEFQPRPSYAGESEPTLRRLKVKFDQKGHERPFQKALIVHLVDGYARPGDVLVIRLGDRRQGSPGTRVQTFAEREFRFRGYVDTAGTSRLASVPGDVVLDIVPGRPQRLVAIHPLAVRPGEGFSILCRLEDDWGNACRDLGEPHHVRLDWVEDPGMEPTVLPPLPSEGWAVSRSQITQLRDGGLARGQLRVSGALGQWTTSLDILATDELPVARALFADLHVHSNHTVGTNDNPWNFHYGRDVAGLDVFGYTANDFQITPARWDDAVRCCREITRSGEFVAFPGTEWNGNSSLGGDRNVVFLSDPIHFPWGPDGQVLRSCDWSEDTTAQATQVPGTSPISELWKVYGERPESHLMIPHVGGRRALLEWHHPELERLVEVASAWGHFEWLLQDALARGYRVGTCANGDEHRGRPGGGAPGVGVFGVHGGLTGVWANELSPASVGQALRARHTWASFGGGRRSVALWTVRSTEGHRGLQGDEVTVPRGATLQWEGLLVGDPEDGGWERVEIRDAQGRVIGWNAHEEQGWSRRIRVSWGGARIPDRYRWSEWRGTITLRGGRVRSHAAFGLEHPEELVIPRPQTPDETTFQIHTDTYGDRDSLVLELESLEGVLEFQLAIGAYNKTGQGGDFHPDPDCPEVTWTVPLSTLMAEPEGLLTQHLGGQGLRLEVERLGPGPFPAIRRISTTMKWEAGASSAYYLWARQFSGAEIIASPIFLIPEGDK